jgi:hypothetical protein
MMFAFPNTHLPNAGPLMFGIPNIGICSEKRTFFHAPKKRDPKSKMGKIPEEGVGWQAVAAPGGLLVMGLREET